MRRPPLGKGRRFVRSIGWGAPLVVLLGSCAQSSGRPAGPASAAPFPAVPLSVSSATSSGAWAVVPMGHLDDPDNTFWQLFERSPGAASWTLVTPPGVADNGGLVTATGTNGTVTVGFEPSEALVFSPLSQSSDQGGIWSPGAVPLQDGLALEPDSLAEAAAGTLFALEPQAGGSLMTLSSDGSSWRAIVTAKALARSAGAGPCGVGSLTAVALDPTGDPMLGTTCGRKATAGVFVDEGGRWTPAGLAPGTRFAGSPTSVVRLVTTASGVSGLLGVGSGFSAGVVAFWSPTGLAPWTVSQRLVVAGSDRIESTGIGLDGEFVVLLKVSGGTLQLETVAGPGSGWESLAPPPSGTENVVAEGGGGYDALTVVGGTKLVDWVLGSPTGTWEKGQTITVPIEYGTSS